MSTDQRPRIHWHPQFKHLKPWTDVATKGLSEDARARILEEITAHFEDAIEAGMQRGMSEEEAARRAVEDLGSPIRAFLFFRRTYLTRFQAKNLQHLFKRPVPDIIAFGFLGLIVAGRAVLAITRPDDTDVGLRVALGTVAVFAFTARVIVAPRLYERARRRAAVALAATAEFLLWSAFSLSGPRTIEDSLWVVPVFLLIVAAGYLPLVLKAALPDVPPVRPAHWR